MVNEESGHSVYDILKMQRTILKIQEIVNAEPFSAKEARNEICAINLEHPENLVIYGLLFPQNSSGTRIVDADKECLICDLQWKQYYLSAKCVGKSIDEMRKNCAARQSNFRLAIDKEYAAGASTGRVILYF